MVKDAILSFVAAAQFGRNTGPHSKIPVSTVEAQLQQMKALVEEQRHRVNHLRDLAKWEESYGLQVTGETRHRAGACFA